MSATVLGAPCLARLHAADTSRQVLQVSVSFDVNNPPSSSNRPPAPNPSPNLNTHRHDRSRLGFVADFRRFFLNGLKALMPTLITLSVVLWIWDLLWDHLGWYLIKAMKWTWSSLSEQGLLPFRPNLYIGSYWSDDKLQTHVVGVLLAIVAVYIVGLVAGNLIGRAFWKLGERLVMKVPIIRAIYPAVKQVTDFVLADHREQFLQSRVVAVRPHDGGIWSVGLVTGSGLKPLSERTGEEMITVFVPSSPTAFSGYVLVVPRSGVVELPMRVEEALRLLVSGGVIEPPAWSEQPTVISPKQPERPVETQSSPENEVLEGPQAV